MKKLRSTTATRARASMAVGLIVAVSSLATFGVGSIGTAHAAAPSVLRVGTWKGIPGTYSTIDAAVGAAKPGDWVLVAPGDYHPQMDHHAGADGDATGAVHITTPNLHLRGMDRNGVVIDGTKPGAPKCSSAASDQDLGPLTAGNQPNGRNGVEVFEANDVSVDNLTVCNFLNGAGGGGNQVWFNGGDGTGTINLDGYSGSYLSTTTTYYAPNSPAGSYGLFVSNTRGPGTLTHTYGSNMNDAAYYVGACTDCRTTLDDAHGVHSALGYSGTNSGGRLLVQNSEFNDNKSGFVTNSQNNDDAPSPQDGSCPSGVASPVGTTSCWVFTKNYVHDNNDPNVPAAGSADFGPIGSGVVISGGRFDTVTENRISNNGSWGVLVVPYIDSGTPPPIAHCDGGQMDYIQPGWCYYWTSGNDISNNTFSNNGSFGNVTNGDLGDLSDLRDPGNCWHGNTQSGGGAVSSAPVDLQVTNGTCGVPNQGEAVLGSDLSNQVICATQVFGPCPEAPGYHYPRATTVTVAPLPAQTTMPDPCAGVPTNPWCPASATVTTVPGTPTTTPAAPATPIATEPRFTG